MEKQEIKEKKRKLSTTVKFDILAIIAIIIFCIALSPVSLQNDTFYTIKIGEHIMQNGIDMQDPFSWHENLPYTYPHWLYDVCTYLIYSVFGMAGIYVCTCALACILGISLYKVNTNLVKNQLISFLITLGAMYLIAPYIAARAQLVTFILFVLTIYFIEKFLETKKKRYAIGLIIIPTLIANLHLAVWPFYFVLYLPFIGEYIIAVLADTIIYKKITIKNLSKKIIKLSKKQGNEEEIQKLQVKLQETMLSVEKRKAKRKQAKKNVYKINIVRNDNVKLLIIIMVICILTGLLTPLGTTPYTYLIKTMQGNTTQNIGEHLPMTIINHTSILCTLVIFLGILIFTDTKIRLKDLFMLAGLTYLMLYSRRQSTMFVLMGAMILNRLATNLFEKYDEGGIKEFTDYVVTKLGILITIGTIIVLSIYFIKPKLDDKFINESSYPVAACDYILENLDVQNIKLFNDYNYGSYLLFRGIPVFIDSRCDLYAPEYNTPTGNPEDGQDIFMDFINTSSLNIYYEETFEKYGMTHVITYKDSKINMLISKREDNKYKELYSDDSFVIYEINK